MKHNHNKERASLRFFYHTVPGRVMLKTVSSPKVSRVCGKMLDSRLSKPLARRFSRKNNITAEEYYGAPYRSFNDCFTRKIREELRPVEKDPSALIAPCDGWLCAYPITDGAVFPVKQSWYTIDSLLNDSGLAARFRDGICLVFRLAVNNYHRYCYVDDGTKGVNNFIPGKLHTVRPIALEKVPVFTKNSREYTVIHSPNFGTMVQMEVGALLVGKIHNYHEAGIIRRGDEKGMFLYGGSTVILLLEKDSAVLDRKLFSNMATGKETPVQMGQRIGKAAKTAVSPKNIPQ